MKINAAWNIRVFLVLGTIRDAKPTVEMWSLMWSLNKGEMAYNKTVDINKTKSKTKFQLYGYGYRGWNK